MLYIAVACNAAFKVTPTSLFLSFFFSIFIHLGTNSKLILMAYDHMKGG